jgi:hypothetical protein
MFSDQFYNRRADDNAIGNARDIGGLFGGSDAKADGDGQVCVDLQARDGFVDTSLGGDL